MLEEQLEAIKMEEMQKRTKNRRMKERSEKNCPRTVLVEVCEIVVAGKTKEQQKMKKTRTVALLVAEAALMEWRTGCCSAVDLEPGYKEFPADAACVQSSSLKSVVVAEAAEAASA